MYKGKYLTSTDCELIGTTTTDANGNYAFNDSNVDADGDGLADIYDEQDNERKPPLKLGTAMYDKQYDTCIDAHKIDIVSTQIQELAIKYPNEERILHN